MSQVPAPGWYPNPENPRQIRWWDGQQWTDHTEPVPQEGSFPPPTGPPPGGTPTHPGFYPSSSGPATNSTSEWLSEVIGLIRGRAGHMFTLAVVLGLLPNLVQGVVMHLGLRDMVFEYADDGTSMSLEGMTWGWAWALIGVFFVSWFISLVMWVSFARQIQTARVDRPEPWSESLKIALARFPRMLGNQFLLALMFIAGLVVISIVTGILALGVGGFALIPALVAVVLMFVRLALITPASAVAPQGVGSVSHGLSVAKGHGKFLFKRMATAFAVAFGLFLVTFIVSQVVAAPSGPELVPTREGFSTLSGNQIVGSSFISYMLSLTISWLSQAATSALMIGGLVVAYGDLGGRFEASLEPKIDSQI